MIQKADPDRESKRQSCFTFVLDGQKHEVTEPKITAAEIMRIGNITPQEGLLQCLEDGTQRQVDPSEEIKLVPCPVFRKAPIFKRGDQAADRRLRELDLVRSKYKVKEVDPNLGWFIVDHALPPAYNKERTDVLVQIPPSLPAGHPDNFLTEPDLRLKNGSPPGNTGQGPAIAGRSWLQFSFHVQGGWNPHPEPERGDNLLTYLLGVTRRLEEGS